MEQISFDYVKAREIFSTIIEKEKLDSLNLVLQNVSKKDLFDFIQNKKSV